MYQRIGAAAYRPDLKNILSLCSILKNPERNFLSVHIAGTNGKGSVSHMLASVLQEAGYKTGLFTSPHLKDFRERVRINGEMIPENDVVEFVNGYRDAFDFIRPSFFEWTTALAFSHFSENKVDVAVIETGLGGRLDSTNVINPLLSVITNISFDHMHLLGDTLEKIASEKAGIIKKNIPVVIGEKQSDIEQIFIDQAMENNSTLFFASENFKAERIHSDEIKQYFSITGNNEIIFEKLPVGLKGNYQEKNLCTVLQAVEILKSHFPSVNRNSIITGMHNIKQNTHLRGRWDVLSLYPLTIADVAHNPAGISCVVDQLSAMQFENLHFVLGMVNDKDSSAVLSVLPKKVQYYFCKSEIPRSMDANELKLKARHFDLYGEVYSSVSEAYRCAQQNSKEGDVIFIGGSTFVVAEII